MNYIKLNYLNDKKYKSIQNREVFINADKIRFMQRKSVAGNNAQTEIWFNSKDCIVVAETPVEIISLIQQGFQGKTEKELIKFKKDFDSKEYEDFIKREG